MIDDGEFERRKSLLKTSPAPTMSKRGYARLFQHVVPQADQGCDFDFMVRPPDEAS
ncbi:hypothetical protein LJR009_001074 [Bosea sp. LjRoot9]|uniref:hypothetical protein n=1 Tax=Bosea sp. LjRoot9 TaxID=3342341 RepID=UPI003ED01A51